MKADEEWDILERKIAGTEAGFEVRGSPKILDKDVATKCRSACFKSLPCMAPSAAVNIPNDVA